MSGPVAADRLGVTLPHEHVFIDLMREYRGNGLLHDEALAAVELGAFKTAGGSTIVDCTSEGLGRDPLALRRVAQATTVNIVMPTRTGRVFQIGRPSSTSQMVFAARMKPAT